MNYQFITADKVDLFAIVTGFQVKMGKNGEYADITLKDKLGEVNAKIWNYSEHRFGKYQNGDLVKVRGVLSEYQGKEQISIENIREVNNTDPISIYDVIPSFEIKSDEMYEILIGIANEIKDDELKLLVTTIYNENKDAIMLSPAAKSMHHEISGGLLYHTLSIVRLAQSVAKVYPSVDEDLLIAGAMLHDVEKIEEYTVSKVGIVEDYGVKGNLLGHIPMGAMLVETVANRLNISEETKMLVEHMILSHHGEPEYGAAVRPAFLEAEILSELDMMDARVYEINKYVSNVEKGSFTQKIWALNNVMYYNHGRKSADRNANLK